MNFHICKLQKGIWHLLLLFMLLTGACPSTSFSMSCKIFFAGETYSKETYLKYFLNQNREPWHQPPPHDWPFIHKVIEKYSSSNKKSVPDLVGVLAYLKSYYYEVTVGRIMGSHTEKITGQIVEFQRFESWVGGKWVLGKISVYTEAGQVIDINYADLDPVILEVRQTSIPKWVSEESKFSKLATRLGIESLTHNVGYHAGTDRNALNTIVQIFKDGHLGRPARFQGGRASSFFSFKGAQSENLSGQIDFDMRLLDRKDYFINNFQHYGRFTEKSIRFDETERMRKYLFYLGRFFKIKRAQADYRLIDGGEFVVWAHVPVTMIKKIHLRDAEISWLLNKLEEENVKPPKGRTWNEIFVTLPISTK
jgi:hypothetical protein